MQSINLLDLFITPLRSADIPYMITGSVAALFYGEPRLTHDVDLLVSIQKTKIHVLQQAFPESEYYLPPLEVIQIERNRPIHGHFNIIHHETGYKADIYLVHQDPLHLWAWKLKKEISLHNQSYWVAPPEYVILRKLEYYRQGESSKHLQDIRAMLGVSKDLINPTLLSEWIEKLKLNNEWQLCLHP